MGHIHGERLVDLPFPMKIRNELVNSGRVSPHPECLLWVSYWVNNGEKDVPVVLGLFRMRYEQLNAISLITLSRWFMTDWSVIYRYIAYTLDKWIIQAQTPFTRNNIEEHS